MPSPPIPFRQIRAVYDADTIRVYQAYNHAIADAALAAGTFVSPFKTDRMTWIKPSFCWMLYRAGYGRKDPGQARILGIDIRRAGFEWALAWIVRVTDLTELAHQVDASRDPALLPAERPYPVPPAIAARIGVDARPGGA